jgi:nitrile hydratase
MSEPEHRSESPPAGSTDPEDRARALQSLLVEKGLASTDAIDEIVSKFEEDIGPMNGARAVAKAWTNPEYKEWLLEDASAALDDLGYTGIEGVDMGVFENTPDVHNVIVCTLCSCFPWPTLGLPPTWYKAPPYRAKMVKHPRRTLREEFGVDLDDDVELKIWDTSAEIRYMVLPQRPEGTEGMSEDELAELVTRDSMIGVERLGDKHVDELR